jgi:hypothetical protein
VRTERPQKKRPLAAPTRPSTLVVRAASAVSASHRRTQKRVLEEWESRLDLEALLSAWDSQVKPSTALLWTRTLLSLKPNLRNALTRRMITVWERESAVVTRRALVADPGLLRKAVISSDINTARTIQVMWTSACRHADLLRATTTRVAPDILQMTWGWQKSDLRGKRHLCKFIVYPHRLPQWAGYHQVYRAVKKVDQQLTVHSIRRGALTYLASRGFSHAQIGKLSLHTPQSDEALAVRRYVDPHFSQPEGQLQLQMSKALWQAIHTPEVTH